ncbi:MAG TPA: diguanylate cyclase [Solirubrobacteraceae bacterium]|nr:diguanylate cyclase [Solirubrobacteraceae bacterium]
MRGFAARWLFVGCAFIAAVLVASWAMFASERDHQRATQRGAQRQAAVVLRDSVDGVLSGERALARVLGALQSPIGSRWPVLANIVTSQAGASSAGFIQPVTQRDRAAFERATGLRLTESPAPGVVVPAASRPLHLVATESYSTTPTTSALGLDLAANPLRAHLMLEAAATGRQTASPPVQFLGKQTDRYGVIVYVPARDARHRLLGWVTATYRAQPLLAAVTAHLPGVRLTIKDGDTVLVSDAGRQSGAPSILDVGGRRWSLWATTTAAASIVAPWLVLGFGLCLAATVMLMLRQADSRERYATAMLAQRDAEEVAVSRIATLVAEQVEPEAVFALVAEEVGQLLDSRTATVSRFDSDHETRTIIGSWTPQGEDFTGVEFGLDGVTASAEVFRTGAAARIGSYTGPSDQTAPVISTLAGGSGVAAPIIVGGRLWGAIGAAFTDPARSVGAEVRLERFARLVGLAISNTEAWDKLARQASTDPLTGLANRRAFDEHLQSELARQRRYGRDLSVALLDIDHFKRINDTHGHPAGDRVLVRLACLLTANARDGELIARIGGEEFAWVMPETDAAGAFTAADRARRAIEAEVFADLGTITVSAGVRQADTSESASALIGDADQALYEAKAKGRNTTVIHDAAATADLTGA